jgi:hypothetical protein
MASESKLITNLKELYSPLDNKWVTANSLLLNLAKKHKLALGGSIGLSISRKNPIKDPSDIDFFTNSYDDAWAYATQLLKYLSEKKGSYGKLMFNNETKFTLEGVKNHIRIQGPPYWKPICIMVLKEPMRTFFWNRVQVQFFSDIVAAAKKTTEIDKKVRIDFAVNFDESDPFVGDFEIISHKTNNDKQAYS